MSLPLQGAHLSVSVYRPDEGAAAVWRLVRRGGESAGRSGQAPPGGSEGWGRYSPEALGKYRAGEGEYSREAHEEVRGGRGTGGSRG